MVNPSYKLENMLETYQQYLLSEEKANTQEKNDTAKALMNIILIGGENLNDSQVEALRNFRNRFLTYHSNDAVVNLISQVLNSISTDIFKASQKIQSRRFPNDAKNIIQAFKNVSDFDLLPLEKQKEVLNYVINRLQDTKDKPPYSDLCQFTKIIAICSDKPDLRIDRETIATCLFDLTQDIQPSDEKFALEFKELATPLIEKFDAIVPNDIQNNPSYHGNAIELGFSQLEKMQEQATTKVTLTNFANIYANDHLKNNEYLIRNSSTVSSFRDSQARYFTVTISFKDANGQLFNSRVTRIRNKEGEISWKWGADHSNQDFKNGVSFKTIEETFLKSAITADKNYQPTSKAPPVDITEYVLKKWPQ